MNTRITGLLAALTLAVAVPTAADAMTFLNAGDTGTVTIFGFDKVTEDYVGSLTADLKFTLLSKTDSKTWNFTYEADNTSTDQVARLVSFALSVDPNFQTVSGTSGPFTATAEKKLEDFATELCFVAGNNCAGGGNGGLTSAAANATGAFTLNFKNAPTGSVTFDAFAGKFQATQYNGSSLFAQECPVGQNCGGGGTEVPEPATWALMIMGFGAAGAMLRRRRTAFA